MRIPQIIATASRGTGGLNEVEVEQIAAAFREAFEADVEDDVKAEMIYDLDQSMRGRYATYTAVGWALGSRYKNLIRVYVTMHKQKLTAPPSLILEDR